MRKVFETLILNAIQRYCTENGLQHIWKRPIVRFADAADPGFEALRRTVTPAHHLPADYLPDARTVISYFLPFTEELADGNLPGANASPAWARAYLDTNRMAVSINEALIGYICSLGCNAAQPADAGMISPDNPRSRWSQRHVAHIAGHGAFGLNNMLISDAGCVGRYFSIVTDMPLDPDDIVLQERCLYKRDGSCGLCIERCAAQALTYDGFDRFKCLERCMENDAIYPGADVCGKCIVALPCSHGIPK